MISYSKFLAVLLAALIVAVLSAPLAAAQSDVTYRARLTTGVAKLGEELTLLVVVENSPATVDSIAKVDGLDIGSIGSPSIKETIEIRGARRSATRTWTWRIPVRPLRTGEFVIPGVELTIGTQRVTSGPLELQVVEDLLGEELGFLDVKISGGKMVEKMPFELELIFGWDVALASKIDYANLILPWWGRLNELLEIEGTTSLSSKPITIDLNTSDRIQVEEIGTSKRDGRTYRTFRMRRVFLPTRSAELNLAEPFLEFGRRAQRGIFGSGREKEAYFVAGDPIVMSIGSLPTEGQPLDYTGAVGNFEVRADVDTRDVDVGESIKVLVTWTGDGNLLFFDEPQLDRDEDFERFRVFGSANREKSLRRRAIEFDIAALDDKVGEIPPIKLPVYDPNKGEFVTVATDPVRIRVRPLRDAVTLGEGEDGSGLGNDIEDIETAVLVRAEYGSSSSGPGLLVLGLLGGAVFVGWIAFRIEYRRRKGDPNAPVERRRRRARKRLANELAAAQNPAEELSALNRFLAARSREPDVAWVGRDPAEHPQLEQSEVGEKLAEAIVQLERGAYAAVKNGAGVPGNQELLQLADQLIRGGL